MLELFKILADQTRLRLLQILRQGDFTVQDLMQILDMGQSRISRHLKLLSEAGLLKVEKEGTWHYYRLASANPVFDKLWPMIGLELDDASDTLHDNGGVTLVMTQRRQRSQRFFDQYAKDWDHIHDDLLSLPEYRADLVALLPKGGCVVEVGTGSGGLLPELAQVAERVVALDSSPAMVNLARETVAKADLSACVDVRLAEMNHLPFTDGEIDSVVLNQVLHHAERPDAVFKEIRRVLEADGKLVLADLTRHNLDWTRDKLADQWLGFSRNQLEQWLDEAGMVSTHYEVIGQYQEIDEGAAQPAVLLLTAKIKATETKM